MQRVQAHNLYWRNCKRLTARTYLNFPNFAWVRLKVSCARESLLCCLSNFTQLQTEDFCSQAKSLTREQVYQPQSFGFDSAYQESKSSLRSTMLHSTTCSSRRSSIFNLEMYLRLKTIFVSPLHPSKYHQRPVASRKFCPNPDLF